jgi:hypothetical protein
LFRLTFEVKGVTVRNRKLNFAAGVVAWMVMVSGFVGAAGAAERDVMAELEALKARVAEQDARIAQLQGNSDQSWLTEQRKEQVRALVREVIADADTRASTASGGTNAGYQNGFFIADDDGNFLLKFNSNVQVRYVYNSRRTATNTTTDADKDENGFQLRRAQLNFSGYVFDPAFTFRVRFNPNATDNTVVADYMQLGYELNDYFQIVVGQGRPAFLREEQITDNAQLTVEWSYLDNYFGLSFAKLGQLIYWQDRLLVQAGVHDGSNSAKTDFNTDRSDVALNGRVDYIIEGAPELIRQRGWKQMSGYASWADDPRAIMLGAAIDYEIGEHSEAHGFAPDIFKWTVDLTGSFGGWSLFAAVVGQTFDSNGTSPGTSPAGLLTQTALDKANQYGVLVQGNVFLIADKLDFFARYQYIDFDGAYYRPNGSGFDTRASTAIAADKLNIVTAGFNWYFSKHQSKFTIEAEYFFNPVPAAATGADVLATPTSDQIVLRSQVQLAF